MKIKYILAGIALAVSCSFVSHTSAYAADFVVVVDAGHGGKDAGAVDNGQKEKDINLAVAQKLAAKIRERLRDVKVVLTRDDDRFLTLQERADIANRNKGNLFISIHTNSVDASNPGRNSVAGASVYALGLHKDKNNLQVAMRENSVIELESNYTQKYSGFNPKKDESYIIFEMAQKKNLGQSLKYAELAQKNMVSIANRADRGVKQAGFWVLWATSMPAVLVELDFICNPLSAAYMGSEKGRDQLAEALCKGLETYLSTGGALPQLSVLGSVVNRERRDTPPSIAGLQSDTTKRRRRNEEAKRNSINRDVATDVIPLKREMDRLAKVETEEPAKVETKPEPVEKGKRKEVEKKKNRTSNVKDSRKRTETSPVDAGNTRVAAVSDAKGAGSKAADAKGAGSKAADAKVAGVMPVEAKEVGAKGAEAKEAGAKGAEAKGAAAVSAAFNDKQSEQSAGAVSKRAVVYKIQIASGTELLRLNHPGFKGLRPVKSFREGDVYKYTYGETTDRAEIEKMLKSVKELIPDAFIITNKR